VRLAARQLSMGQSVKPPPEIIFYMLAKEFGKFPWEVEEQPLCYVLKAWALHAEMQPKEVKRGRQGL
jgi:hypothetical protein